MFRIIMLSLALAACATPGGAYMDGAPLAPVEPRVTYAPAGAGLPEYWGTPEAPKVERSPHSRELPPTREPGLWAGDQPRAAGDDLGFPVWTIREPIVFDDIMLPTPDGADIAAQAPARRCAYMIDRISKRTSSGDVRRMTTREKMCAAALLFVECMKKDIALWKRVADKDAVVSEKSTDRLFSVKRDADDFMDQECESDARTPRVESVVRRVMDNWEKMEVIKP